MSVSTKQRRRQVDPPSSPAYGAVVLMALMGAAVILLTYTLWPLPGQRELGALSYWVAAFLVLLTVILLKCFRRPRVVDEDPAVKPRVRSRARRGKR